MNNYGLRDYRFDALIHGLRKNDQQYFLSRTASNDLEMNDSTGIEEYTQEMWDDFYSELIADYQEGQL